jgi:Diaphanous GTPase-binding Domain/Diaphanous FH3 Domain
MPDKDALYRSFNQLLGSLDLPDDKIEEMNSYDDHKKWEILCSRSLMKVHQSPSFYQQRLRGLAGLRAPQPKTDETSEMLRGLEVSLRTYSIDWLHEFLCHPLDGFVELIDGGNLSSEPFQILIRCLKVIVSDSKGFDAAINHPRLFDALARSLSTLPSTRSRCSVLQLLAMAGERDDRGHERIRKSLKVSGGVERLIDFLATTEQMVIVTTLKLISVVVNSPLDLNYRVHLQYELRQMGLQDRLDRLMRSESTLASEVIAEIKRYESMLINVNQLAGDRAQIREERRTEAERQSINCVRQPRGVLRGGLDESLLLLRPPFSPCSGSRAGIYMKNV